jgi:hypothetical protein
MSGTVADFISGLLLLALATTLVAHKQTANDVKAATSGIAEDLKAGEGYGLGEP